MDSDSDSDGSHISATPPRDLKPSSPPQPTPSLSRRSLFSSYKPRTTASSSRPKLISQPKRRSSKSAAMPKVSDLTAPEDPLPVFTAALPFQIRSRPSDQDRAVSVQSLETLPAGFFSKSVSSFSKFRGASLNFDPVEDDPFPSSPLIPQPKVEIGIGSDCLAADRLPEEFRDEEVVSSRHSQKVVKKHSNLIGGNAPMPAVKLWKCGGEGNFVRLNLNRKRKFMNKGRRGNSNYSGGRRFYKRKKKNLRAEGGEETANVFEEDGLVVDTTQHLNQKLERKKANFNGDLIEEAIQAAKNEPSDDNLVKLLRLTHGHDSFRDGQLEAIKMVLAGKSSMLVLPTGAGKSLCYQLPAIILPGITLVVSPLVALMIDQLKQLPPMIQGGLLSSSQTHEEVFETRRLIQQGTMKVLFVSPERFLNAEFLAMFSATVFISLVVVDEAHCISEWSHNFRPSYMRLRASLLKAKLNVDCFLAMTATATTTTLNAVMSALEIPSSNLIKKSQLRENFQLSVTLSRNRMKDLLSLIKSSPFMEVQSIIIYCKFQSETDLLSRYLCDYNIPAKSYHSGIPAKDRSRIQESFCANKIRVVVATVAFGMGLDKRDVGAVIHYSLPESLEEYVQEIGRAGRDGRLSYCHLFLDDDTYFKLRSLMFCDGVDRYAVDKFISQVFAGENSRGKIRSLVKESASRKFDMKEEVMFTLLTQMELGDVQYVRLLPQTNVTCSLCFHKTPPEMLAGKNVVVGEILKKCERKDGQYAFDIPTLANSIGVMNADISNQLQNLKLKGEVTYELKDQAYCYTIVKVPEDYSSLSAHLTKWLSEVESCKVCKLDAMFNAAMFAVNSCEKLHGCSGAHHTPCLQRRILDYFNKDDNCDVSNKMGQSSPFLRADIKVFLQSNSQAKFTPRAVARIMHGIASPAYPSTYWSKTHFWGRYTKIDFHAVMEAAKAELINFVGKDAI
ncbi:hypothetical protein UlMin_039901 [Ulmus minor]